MAGLGLALVLAFSLFLRFRVIENGMPYPQHVDEMYLADTGAKILKTGDFNPHFFMYPGLPIYLTAAAMSYGYLDAANHLELQNTAEIGLTGYPYYQHPRVVRPARQLFALFSLAAMALLAGIAWRFGGLLAMVAAPAWLGLSSLYFEQSQAYLNVNVAGCAFAWATIALVLHFYERPDWTAKVILPGILAGLVIACKYNFAAILLTPLLAILWQGGRRRLPKAAALVAIAGATFLACAPYTLLDYKTFLDDLGKITYIYREGTFAAPGSGTFLGHFWLCVKDLARDFGVPTGLFALPGAVVLWRRAPRQAVLVAVLPLLLLFQMCRTPTHLMRNLVPFLPFLALAAAMGLSAATAFGAAALARQGYFAGWPAWRRQALALALLLGAASYFLPFGAPGRWLALRLDSRQQATAWLLENAPKDQPILAARELGLHPGPFREAGLQLQELPVRSTSAIAFVAELARHPGALVLLPRMNSVHWDPATVAAGEKALPRIAALFAEVEPVRVFGSQPTSICFDYPPGGDPQFVVAKARRPLAGLQEGSRGLLLALLPEEFHGEMTQMQGGGLAILAQSLVASRELELPAGALRLEITATGTPVRERYPVVRVRYGELDLGTFVAGEAPEAAAFELTLAAPTRAALTLELVNDEIERDAAGRIVADRNVWLQGALVTSLGG